MLDQSSTGILWPASGDEAGVVATVVMEEEKDGDEILQPNRDPERLQPS
jgi:hypothetical protein